MLGTTGAELMLAFIALDNLAMPGTQLVDPEEPKPATGLMGSAWDLFLTSPSLLAGPLAGGQIGAGTCS